MTMTANFYATLRPIVGGKKVELPFDGRVSVRQVLDYLVQRYPPLRDELLDEHGNLYRHVHIFVNGRDTPYLEQGVDTLLNANDVIDVFPAVAGG